MVHPIFVTIKDLITCAENCISKQIDSKSWVVSYRRSFKVNGDTPNHFLPLTQRLRYVKVNEDGFLLCSCKNYQRYGYPCHHLLHVLKCYSTSEIKKEWIHIRWTKEYIAYHYEPDTNEDTLKRYQLLYDNHPIGIYYDRPSPHNFPIYDGFGQEIPNDNMFKVPDYQFMCQITKQLWIEKIKQTIWWLIVYYLLKIQT